MNKRRLIAAAVAIGLFLMPTWRDLAFAAERRVALVVGNSAYQHVPLLFNPTRDAQSMVDSFKKAGFDVVIAQNNVGNLQFKRAIREFEDAAADADIAVVFYAGHGIELRGVNYMIPVDAKFASDRDADDEAITLTRLVESVDGARRLRLVILDACRDNPFVRTMKRQRTATLRAVGAGLAAVDPSTSETLIAYAAKAGSAAADGDSDHSPFTAALLNHLFVPGLDIRLAFGRVRDQVVKGTGNRQEPFVYGSLGGGNISLVPEPPRVTLAAAPDLRGEASDYDLVEKIGTKGAWEVFLAQHPKGFYSDLARQQLVKLSAEQEKVPVVSKAPEGQFAALEPGKPASSPRSSGEEQRAWDRIKDSSNAASFRDFIKRYPSSVLAITAKTRAEALERTAQEREEKARTEREAKAAEEARLKAEREEKGRAEREAKAAEEARLKAEREEKARAEREAKAAEEARLKAEREEKVRIAREAKAAEEARLKAEREAKAAEEARLKAEREERLRAEREAKAAEEARLKTEREAAARRAEEERLAKLSEAERVKAERELELKRLEQERQAKLAEEARVRQEAAAEAAQQKAEQAAAQAAQAKLDAACKRDEGRLGSLQSAGWRARDDLQRLEQELGCERLRPNVVAALQRALALPVSNTLEQVRAAQQELKRLGCFEGTVDGDLGIVTRTALNRYLTQRSKKVPDVEITDAFVSELKSQTARVCPLVCPPGKVVEGEQCVVPPKPAPVAQPKSEDQDKRQNAKHEDEKSVPRQQKEDKQGPRPQKSTKQEDKPEPRPQKANKREPQREERASRPEPRVRQEAEAPARTRIYGGGGGGGGGHGPTIGVGF